MNKKEFAVFKPGMLYISRSSSLLDGKVDEIKYYLKDRINLDADFKIFFAAEGFEESEFLNFFNTPPFFSDIKVTVIKDVDRLSMGQVKKISYLLKESDPKDSNTILILTSLKEKLNKDLLQSIKKNGVIKRLTVPHTDSLKKWLEEKAELDGIRFTQSASVKLIENVNFDLTQLKKEYEKLYIYVLDKKERVIDEKAVVKLVSRVYEMKIFDLVDYIGNREKNNAIRALKSIILEKQSITGLVTLLFRMFKFMLYLKGSEHTTPAQHEHAKNYIASHLGHAPYMLGRVTANYTRFSKKYSGREIISIISLLNTYDVLLRKGVVAEYNLVLKMINEICEVKVL